MLSVELREKNSFVYFSIQLCLANTSGSINIIYLPTHLYLWLCAWVSTQSSSCVWLFATPWTVAHQAPLSMGFFRQKYSNGLLCLPPGDLPNPGIKPRSLALQVDSLLSEPPGKPMNTGVGSPSLLQGIFLTQESTRGLLHCRQILYLVSYQEAHLPTYLSTYLPISL